MGVNDQGVTKPRASEAMGGRARGDASHKQKLRASSLVILENGRDFRHTGELRSPKRRVRIQDLPVK